jgi:hypothetical protein
MTGPISPVPGPCAYCGAPVWAQKGPVGPKPPKVVAKADTQGTFHPTLGNTSTKSCPKCGALAWAAVPKNVTEPLPPAGLDDRE